MQQSAIVLFQPASNRQPLDHTKSSDLLKTKSHQERSRANIRKTHNHRRWGIPPRPENIFKTPLGAMQLDIGKKRTTSTRKNAACFA